MRRPLPWLTSLFALASSPAFACTICHSPTAQGVRHLLLEHDPWRHGAALAAPLPLLAAAILFAARERPK